MKASLLELLSILAVSFGIAFALFKGIELSDNVETIKAEQWKSQGFPIGE